MNKNTILVTGAGGFVGFATVKKLLSSGHRVRALELPASPYVEALKLLAQQHSDLTLHTANICNSQELEPVLQGVTHVIHSAALLNSIAPKSTFEAVNVLGAKNVIEAAKQANVERFLLVSTSDVFGIPRPGEIISETTPYRSWGEPYADTKIAACELLKSACANHDMEFSIIYPGWVYGPGDKQFFPAIIDMLRDKDVFLWHRDKPYAIDFIFIEDLV
ncbi:MAG: NAD-dependent epimerase/dehydratase family protein, partial [Pseudomonadales bacterium]|nr:NAD-dependent epimerase/dehydratase family protein [Pseudomonadales bacterium]